MEGGDMKVMVTATKKRKVDAGFLTSSKERHNATAVTLCFSRGGTAQPLPAEACASEHSQRDTRA